MLRYDRTRAFARRWFVFGGIFFILLAIIVRLDVVAELVRGELAPPSGWAMEFLTETVEKDAFLFFLPVLCSLPYGANFIEEYQSGITKFALGRIRQRQYLWSKAIATALSGGVMVVWGIFLFLLVVLFVFYPLEAKATEPGAWVQPVYSFLWLVLRYFCFGALGAMTGQMVSTAVNNRYMAWLAPFMAEYVLIIFSERYFSDVPVFYPKDWLAPPSYWPWGGASVCVWMGGLTVFLAWAFVCLAKRRLKHV